MHNAGRCASASTEPPMDLKWRKSGSAIEGERAKTKMARRVWMTELYQFGQLGQSIWYDNIRRALLDSGDLAALVEAGVSGVTSNPTIFEKAIAGSTDYDDAMRELVDAGKSVEEVYLGDDGLIGAVREGQILADHSTVNLRTSKRMA